MTVGFADLFVSAGDGLRLYARDYGSHHVENLPVVCLPGFARTSMDFHELATLLSSDPGKLYVALAQSIDRLRD